MRSGGPYPFTIVPLLFQELCFCALVVSCLLATTTHRCPDDGDTSHVYSIATVSAFTGESIVMGGLIRLLTCARTVAVALGCSSFIGSFRLDARMVRCITMPQHAILTPCRMQEESKQLLLFSLGVFICGLKGDFYNIGLLNVALSSIYWQISPDVAMVRAFRKTLNFEPYG